MAKLAEQSWAGKVYLGADHRGFPMKRALMEFLLGEGFAVEDLGTYSDERVDYPDYARLVAERVAREEGAAGVLICGSGVGICMAANRIKGARAAPLYAPQVAEMTRRHNNANIACFSGDWQTPEEAKELLRIFLTTGFEGGRHLRRIRKLDFLDREEAGELTKEGES